LPLWHHPGENRLMRQVNNRSMARCLRSNHAGLTVEDGMDLKQRLGDPLHEADASCDCDACEEDRTVQGCEDPHVCAKAAASRLGQILPKWIPKISGTENPVPDAAPTDLGIETGCFKLPRGMTTLAQGLRVMTQKGHELKERPVPPIRRRRAAVEQAPEKAGIYIAGAVYAPSSRRACAAAGVFLGDADIRNKGRCIPVADDQSQYVAELFAVLEAIRI
ncbi:hypothetical protein DFH07DRAFT_717915, partial [Mycena maculata]